VAEKLEDGPAEPDSYVMFANARASGAPSAEMPAVTITVAKRKGTNASVLDREMIVLSRSKKAAAAAADPPPGVSMAGSIGGDREIQSPFTWTDW